MDQKTLLDYGFPLFIFKERPGLIPPSKQTDIRVYFSGEKEKQDEKGGQ